MKLITRKDRIEGDGYKLGSFITFGRSTLSTGKADGWYVLLEVPFTIQRNYVDPNTFLQKQGPCRKRVLRHFRPTHNIHTCAWSPV